MSQYKLYTYGTNMHHHKDFEYKHNNGINNHLLLCFYTDYEILINSEIICGEKGDCILFSPNTIQQHRTPKHIDDGYVNDWMHFDGNIIKELIAKFNIPTNTIIKTGNPHTLTQYLEQIKEEQFCKEPLWQEYIEKYIEQMLMNVIRNAELYASRIYDQNISYHKNILAGIRRTILDGYSENWDINKMADMANLSSSRFSKLYKICFNISPKEDLINHRIRQAQILLLNSHMSISQISNKCGFKSINYFSQSFKKKVGCTAREYRKL